MNYWQQQDKKPIFTDIMWSKPEQKTGSLLIIGGNQFSFLAVANAYQIANDVVKTTTLILPDKLKKSTGLITDAVFVDSNPSGSLAKSSLNIINNTFEQSDAILMIGDAGKNAETAILYQDLIKTQNDKSLIIARDAVDLALDMAEPLLKTNVTLVLTFAQLQKLFRTIYYPIILTHSMQGNKLVEALHKFTLTYQINLVVFFQNQLLIAKNGQVITQPFDDLKQFIQGNVATQIAIWQIWFPNSHIEAIACAVFSNDSDTNGSSS